MAEELARVTVTPVKDVIVTRIDGEVDLSNVEAVGRQLEEVASRQARLHVVDLTPTTYVDSVGMRMLFVLAARVNGRRGALHLVVPKGSPVRRVIELTDLPSVAPIHDTLDEVLGEE
jgi:anti-sigma B factor antagonist